jgi:hypothetical protein
MCVEHGSEFGLIDHRKRLVDRAHKIMAQIRDKTTERVGKTWTRGNQNLGNAKLARQRGRLERPRAAECQQDEVAGIVPSGATTVEWRRPSCRSRPDNGSGRLFRAKFQRSSDVGNQSAAHLSYVMT